MRTKKRTTATRTKRKTPEEEYKKSVKGVKLELKNGQRGIKRKENGMSEREAKKGKEVVSKMLGEIAQI